jgi:hypothetical protein
MPRRTSAALPWARCWGHCWCWQRSSEAVSATGPARVRPAAALLRDPSVCLCAWTAPLRFFQRKLARMSGMFHLLSQYGGAALGLSPRPTCGPPCLFLHHGALPTHACDAWLSLPLLGCWGCSACFQRMPGPGWGRRRCASCARLRWVCQLRPPAVVMLRCCDTRPSMPGRCL